MNAPAMTMPMNQETLHSAIADAVDTIAPTWPLDRMIAVNPYWGRIGQPFAVAAEELANIAGSPHTLSLDYYADAWRSGEITEADLQQALAENDCELDLATLLAALEEDYLPPVPVPLLSDMLDRQRDLHREPAWCDTITHQISQFCAAYFDQRQADWHPERSGRLYTSWRDALGDDHSVPLLMRAPGIPARARALAADPQEQIAAVLDSLGIPSSQWYTYFCAVLKRVSGWAAWCAYLRWQARLEEREDDTLIDILAIRLSWECLLDDGERAAASTWHAWHTEWEEKTSRFDNHALRVQLTWQRAQEISYQRGLGERLLAPAATGTVVEPAVQAAFCIDVRSEVFRRHLEAQAGDIQTLGFAGFFGLPISYAPLGTAARRPQLPGLLAPALDISDSSGDPGRDADISTQRQGRLQALFGWRTFESVPLSSFTLVESMGLGYLGKLIRRSLPGTSKPEADDALGLQPEQSCSIRPTLDAATAGGVSGQADIAAQVLTGMGLSDNFARLVLLLGHGSQNRNNPHRAGLDCGACCGQTGEVNARALAGLLNDPAVRAELAQRGRVIPDTTVFVAGLHNTTTDEVKLYDLTSLPGSHMPDLERIQVQLAFAGHAARRERAPSLGLDAVSAEPEVLLRAVRERADDWAQTRPEWGLANNAAFVVAPRARTRGQDLQGRSFLHDYDHRKDPDGSLLELIMTAPMIVTNWINMQYYASTVDNRRYGSGNKTLHNVVGGRIGVFEGNGGDLRIGLPWQSLHNGARWLHTPLRLTVVIEAPREAIDTVIGKHDMVRQLLDNQWLHLMRVDDAGLEVYRGGQWQAQ